MAVPPIQGGARFRRPPSSVLRRAGEAEAGIVYFTDLRISEAVRPLLELDSALDRPIVYPLVLMESHGEAARAFSNTCSHPSPLTSFGATGFRSRRTKPPDSVP